MKKWVLAACITIFLAGCNNQAEKIEKLEVEFLELEKSEGIGTIYKRAKFVSHENKAYYLMDITTYEYDYWEIEPGEKLIFEEVNLYKETALLDGEEVEFYERSF